MDVSLTWTKHPILEIPSRREQIAMGAERLLQYWESREGAIQREQDDPYRYGTELPHWKLADEQLADHSELLILGGNRSGKSEYCAKRVVQTLVKNPGAVIWCFTTSSQNSIAFQQALIYKYLPKEFKKLGRSRTYYVSYSSKNGFTSSSFILPNGSTCVFRNFQQDVKTIEGGECGLLGDPAEGTESWAIWLDEEYNPNFLNTLRFRVLTRADSKGIPGRIISSFTTVSGWTNVVSQYLSGARTLESRPAVLLNNDEVPVLQQSIRNARIVYFHTQDNPYNSWTATQNQLKGSSRDEILTRAYGVPTKPAGTVFRNLDDKVIMKHSEIPVIKNPQDNPCAYVLSIDPAGAKPWFMILVAIAPNDIHYVIDEFPDPSYGAWADLEKGNNGVAGEACQPNGYGIKDYAEIIKKMTQGLDDVDMIIDPRLGSASYQKAEGTSNIISDLADEGIFVNPADGLDIETGLQAINSLLAYDTSKPIGFDNHSKLIFSDKCGNTIHCCQNYQVDHGPKAVTKDPPDCLRYVAIGNYRYYEDHELGVSGTGGY